MNTKQLLTIVLKVVASIGGIGVIIVGLSYWIGKMIGENVYLRTQAKYDRELEGLRKQSAVQLEHLRAEIAESQESLKSALSALSTGYALSHERVWEVLALLWNKVVEVRGFSYPYLRLYATAGVSKETFKRLSRISQETMSTSTFEECYNKLEEMKKGMVNRRPFIGNILWYLYSTHFEIARTVCLKAAFGVHTEGFVEWDKLDGGEDDEVLMRRINGVLTEEHMTHIEEIMKKAGANRGFMPGLVLDTIENKIVAEISRWVFGEGLASVSLEQQKQLRDLQEQNASMKNWLKAG